jgi:hypothetical protein
MFKKLTTLALFLTFFQATLLAKIWTVDSNPGNPVADFTTLQDAHDGATSNDTLHVIGSSIGYGNISLTKKLVIIGPGFFLGENPNTQAKKTTAVCGYTTFEVGSNGSKITGVYIKNLLRIKDSNIAISRNLIQGSELTLIEIFSGCSNIVINQNYIKNTYLNAPAIHVYEDYLNQTGASNITISNCYVVSNNKSSIKIDSYCSNCTITNCVLGSDISIATGSFTLDNCILYSGSLNVPLNKESIPRNCIGNANQFASGNGNQQNVDINAVFVGQTNGTTDGQWQLKSGSPAVGVGHDGTDCGMFGGNDPYVLSGIPSIPNIYYFNSPATSSIEQGLPVQLKIRANN